MNDEELIEALKDILDSIPEVPKQVPGRDLEDRLEEEQQTEHNE